MCTFEPEKPEASVDRGARELPLSPGHDPSKTSSFFACNKRYVKCIKSKTKSQTKRNSLTVVFKTKDMTVGLSISPSLLQETAGK